ncbi:hypothetical protein J7T55_007431 [Diaporthe amygdali]|uniref:uncharacterized protein n=1 Tax=Phomopsis amygdali TaxID=1214568 RepID=UPI0022FDCD10|nr:uncharacterized protein J7T55_007431 [Diaporthe amygdali]KAJ0116451.1 hypothetical protein J7T55_007431 [Diaporthe amygdali]
MNRSFAPTSEPQWGLVAHHNDPANTSAQDLTSSPMRDLEGSDGPHLCQLCGKQYPRLCDLNKHSKAHTRPFKCPIEACKYHLLGWPTEKELDRHRNDKHSMEPRTYSCLFPPCTYTSKRESNCKQHMEKSHGWEYVRSRLGHKDEGTSQRPVLTSDVSNQVIHPGSSLTIRTVPGLTVSPSPMAPHNSPASTVYDGSIPYGADVYIPWTSPVTRLRNNENFLEQFSQTYAAGYQGDDEWLKIPVDPQLYNRSAQDDDVAVKSVTSEAASGAEDLLKAPPTVLTPQASPIVKTQVLTPLSEPSPFMNQCPWATRDGVTPQDVESDPGSGFSASRGLRSGNLGQFKQPGKRSVRFSRESDGSEGDGEPPNKRNKAPGGKVDETGDPRMICPFRAEHPEIYDMGYDQKYYSCHTAHDNISTVVLDVDNGRKSISSFGLENNEHGHPAAGLCKRCWRTFSDPEAFENHFNANCEIASRSKREKYGILRKTFCQIDSMLPRSSAEDAGSDDSDFDDVPDAEGDPDDTMPVNTTRAQPQIPRSDVVSRSEHNALMARVAALERMLQPRSLQAIPRTVPSQQETMSQALMSSSAATATQPTQPMGHYAFEVGSQQRHSMAERGGSREPRDLMGGVHRRPVNYRDQMGFNLDTESVMANYDPSVARRSDSMSTIHRTSPITTTHHYESLDGQAKPAPSDSAYGTASNTGIGNAPPTQSTQPGDQMGGGGDEYGQEGISQASSNTRLLNQFIQAEEQREAVMGRASFFNTEAEDMVSNFLNMDSQ